MAVPAAAASSVAAKAVPRPRPMTSRPGRRLRTSSPSTGAPASKPSTWESSDERGVEDEERTGPQARLAGMWRTRQTDDDGDALLAECREGGPRTHRSAPLSAELASYGCSRCVDSFVSCPGRDG
jgi:hypothetical protein